MPVCSSEGNTSKNCTEFHPDKYKWIVISTKFTRSLIAERTERNFYLRDLNNVPALILLTVIYKLRFKITREAKFVFIFSTFLERALFNSL